MERLHILDGYGYIFRAYYGLMTAGRNREGVRLSTSDGLPTGALYVYASMLIRLHLDVKPERIVVVFDHPGKTFRDELDSEYKANRGAPPEDLVPQLPFFRPLTEAFSWPVISVEGFEADDVIATIAKRARARDWEVVIFSADKDLMRLVDGGTTMIDSMRQVTYDRAKVEERFGVPPELVSDWLALVGDSSDNIPGMAGVGKVTASKLLTQYGSLDGVLEHRDELKGKMKERFHDPDALAQLELSRKLTELCVDVPLAMELEDFVPGPWDSERLVELFERFEFAALLDRLSAKSSPGKSAADDSTPSPIADPVVAVSAVDVTAVLEVARQKKRFALHVELDERRADRASIVGLALAAQGVPPVYVPLRHRYLGAPEQLALESLEELSALCADPDVKVICHDAKRLIGALSRAGIELVGVECDSLLISYLIDANRGGASLAEVARTWARTELPERGALLGVGKKKIPYESFDVESAASYCGRATAAVLRAREPMLGALERGGMSSLWTEVERPLASVLARLEARGICLDSDYLAELSERVAGRVADIERQAFEATGESFNLGSPSQLAVILFDKLGLRPERMKKTKTGYSTDHEVLESMRGMHPVVEHVLEHRELVKLKGTYIDALPPLVNPATGRLHTTFRQAVAATGRLSSQDPNLQNIPIRSELGREIRRAFVAAPGTVLVSADYSQIELRVMAHLSRDPVLMAAFERGADIHTQTAAEVFAIAPEKVGAAERRVAKAVNYGLIYGQSDFGLSRALDIPRAQARETIDRYFERFKKVREFMEESVTRARSSGGAVTLLGRRRPIPDIAVKNYQKRTAAERVAQNTPIQGSAADIMKLAMLRADARLQRDFSGSELLLTVHDELVFEVAEERAQELSSAVREEMEGALELDVPLVVDVGIATNWSDAH